MNPVAFPARDKVSNTRCPIAGEPGKIRDKGIQALAGGHRNAVPGRTLIVLRPLGSEIDLRQDAPDLAGSLRFRGSRCGILIVVRRRQPQREIGARRPFKGTADALPLDHAFGFAKARRVDKGDRHAFKIQMHLDHVPRGAGFLGDDGHIPSGERIQQAGLARVGLAKQNHLQAFPQTLRPTGTIEMPLDLTLKPLHLGPHALGHIIRHIVFIGEVERRLDHRARPRQTRPPVIVEIPQRAARLRHGKPSLRFRLCRDQVREPFHLEKVETVVVERPPCKLPRLRRPYAIECRQRFQHGRNDGASTMTMQFGNIFAGKARRRGKPEHQGHIEQVSPAGSAKLAQGRLARRRTATGNRFENESSRRPGNPDDRDTRRHRPARQGIDGIAHVPVP